MNIISRTIFILLFFHAIMLRASGRPELAVALIPDSLLNGANTVVRQSETTLVISSQSEAEYEIHDIITVLNESGADELSDTHSYDQFCKISDYSIKIYDKTGKLLNKHGLSDMKDYSLYDGFSLFNDARLKHIQTNGGQYPITIDRTIKLKYNGFIDFKDWYIQKANQSLETASLMVYLPTDMDIHYKSYNTGIVPSLKIDKVKNYTWTVSGRKAFKTPPESYGERYYCPHIDLSPSRFGIGGYNGSMDSWSEFGKALANMWQNKRSLPDAAVQEIKDMVKGAHSDKEKISILYSYLQKNFHYVSIQIGIGGWIPFDAATVHSVKYGDCKALSNYMCAILGVAGVRSHPVIINAGADQHAVDTAFPSNHFNHAILCAEADGKPFWLECTSTSMPAGELGVFTESRYGLMIGDTSGRLVSTPTSDPELNTISIRHDVKLAASGAAVISGSVSVSGEYRSAAKSVLIQGTDKEQASYLFSKLHIRQPDAFKLSSINDSAAIISVTINGTKENLADFKTDTKSFEPSSFINTWYKNITADNDRKDDLLIEFPFCKREILTYHIDSSYTVSLPADFEMNNELILFSRKVTKGRGEEIIIATELQFKKHVLSPGQILPLKESLQTINKYLMQKLILSQK